MIAAYPITEQNVVINRLNTGVSIIPVGDIVKEQKNSGGDLDDREQDNSAPKGIEPAKTLGHWIREQAIEKLAEWIALIEPVIDRLAEATNDIDPLGAKCAHQTPPLVRNRPRAR